MLTRITRWSRDMASIIYEVIGYDRKTGEVIAEYRVPVRRVRSVFHIAGVSPQDDGFGCYPLRHEQVSEIERVLETTIQHPDCDFFLEPSGQPQNVTR